MLNFGVIGAGRIARTFCDAVRNNQGNLYAIASRNIDKAKDYKNTYGFEKAYDSYEALLNDENVECVYIATPHGLHYDHMMLALKHNKPILCEKAFTLNAQQAEEIFALAKEKKLFVMEAMWTRFLPITKTLQTLLSDGIIGDIKILEADFCFKANVDLNDRLYNPALGAGALLDIGIYPINYANIFLGEPTSFKSTCEYTQTGVDAAEIITYDYPSSIAKLSASLNYDKPRLAKIYGSKGFIHVPNFWAAETATIYTLDGDVIKTLNLPHKVNGFEYQIEETIRCIKEGLLESKFMPHATTISILKQMDALRNTWNIQYPQEKKGA
ncbi:Gfo/Idh/MocA family protein [Liberiplasma polymorphum]|uniref:Gfo/Idh/MocA family protein n=1 Tax=Liberiplasma polymorphum TaxID=3374570 RepID=UPI003773CFA7